MDDQVFEQRIRILVRIIESVRRADWPDDDKQWAVGEVEGLIRKLKEGRPPRQIHGKLSMG